MVFQDYALWPHLNVRKNISFPLSNPDRTREVRQSRVDGLLERGYRAPRRSIPNELSGEEQQRVALARALAADVGLILFDEPPSNLDADRREQLRLEISTLTREAGATAIYITHDQSEAFALADRVGVLNRGSLIQFDTPENVFRRPANCFVTRFTGVSEEFTVDRVHERTEDSVDVSLAFAPMYRMTARANGCDQRADALKLFVRFSGVMLNAEIHDEGVGGEVLDVAFTGRGYEHVVTVGPGATLTKIFSTRRFERDSNVNVSFDPSACLS